MSDTDVRIIDQTTDTSLVDGDYVIVDSQNEGTRKYNLGKEIRDIKEDLQDLQEEIEGGGGGLTNDLKAALDQFAQKVAYIDDDGQDYYNALHNALYPPASLSYITCVYTQSGTVYTTDSLDSLKSDLVVTAHYSNGTTQTVTAYTLSGTLTVGTSTITVSYGGKSTTFNVTVTRVPSSYVTNGLIARFDGIDNTGSGHSSSATTWKDLVGSYDIATPTNSGGTWASDGLVLDGTQGRDFVASTIWTLPEASTIELVLDQCSPATGVTYAVVAGFNSNVCFTICPENTVGFAQPISKYDTGLTSPTDIHHMVALYTGTTVSSAYINGTQAALNGGTASMKHPNNKLILGVQDNSAAGYKLVGKIMAIRVYNRQLTASELQQNLETDAERFGTGGVS